MNILRFYALFFLILSFDSCSLKQEHYRLCVNYDNKGNIESESAEYVGAFNDGPFREDYAYYYHRNWKKEDLDLLYVQLLSEENRKDLFTEVVAYPDLVKKLTSSRSFMDFEDAVRTVFESNRKALEAYLYEASAKYGYSLTAARWLMDVRKYEKLGRNNKNRTTKCFDLFV